MQHNQIDSDRVLGRTINPPGEAEAPMTTTQRPPTDPPSPAPGSNRAMLIAVVVLAVAVAAGLVAAITLTLNREPTVTSPAPTAQPGPSQTVAPPSATPAPPLTAEQQAVDEAEAAYRAYLAIDDQISSTLAFGTDYGAYEQAFGEVATGIALTEAGLAAGDLAAAGQRATGDTRLASLEVVAVSLRDDGDYVPEVVFEACEDFSGVDVLGPDGQSVKDPDGPTRYQTLVTVRNYPELGGWLVAETASDGTTC
jgi:hypothetical protein